MSVAATETPMDVDKVLGRPLAENETPPSSLKKKVPAASSTADQSVLYSPELLQMYYSRLFPYSFLHTWLSYGSQDPTVFSRREFSFTLEPVPGEEIYIRYQSFRGQDDLQAAILKRRPTKIDLGAVFSHAPKDHNTLPKGVLKPVQRELVFDIDLTDYDEIRKCGCTGAKICPTCWGFMQMAVQVMDAGLKEDFGFQHVAWFYSGRRGIHAWVCDEAARALTDSGRAAVAHYFEVNLGTDKNKDVHLPYPLHPMLQRAHAVLEPLFVQQILPAEGGHGLLASVDQWTALLESLPEPASKVRDTLLGLWAKAHSSPATKWEELKKHLSFFLGKAKGAKVPKQLSTKEREKIEQWPVQTVFRHTYPRLDINVSKMRNHLLKSPFCVHPKTGRVCVPIQADEMDDFDPFIVPTLGQLMEELDAFDQEHGSDDKERSIPNWQKTSLKGYYEPFVKEFLEPLQKSIRRQEREAAEQKAAVDCDF